MTSSRLFPDNGSSAALSLGSKTPFLDLDWLFSLDTYSLDQKLKEAQCTRSKTISFESYKKQREKKKSAFAKEISAALEPNDQFDEFALHADYLIDIGPASLSSDQFGNHFERLRALVESPTFQNDVGASIAYLIIAPALAWRRSSKLDERVRLDAVKNLESAIYSLQQRASTPRLDADWLDLQNQLTYAYVVVASALDVPIHSPVLSGHLIVFRKCSARDWSSLRDDIQMRFTGLAFHLTRSFFDLDRPFETKHGFSHGTLADLRSLFLVASTGTTASAFTTHQWVYRWISDKLDSDVFSVRSQSSPRVHVPILSETEQLAIVELARRFSGYRSSVTTDSVTRFVFQFGNTERIRGALRMLAHIKFLPLWELSSAMERILASELKNAPNQKLIVAPMGDQTGSTSIIRYMAAHSKLRNLEFRDDIQSALASSKKGDQLHFIDDCLLSGTQALSILGDWMGTRKHKQHHTVYSRPLNKGDREKLADRSLVFSYCVTTDDGPDRFLKDFGQTGLSPERIRVNSGVVEPRTSKAFEPLGPVGWASERERESVKEFAREVGYEILRDRSLKKEWTDQRRSESALGYSDFQRLLVFPYNVPKTTLTFLWERGNDVTNWQPLFPGYD